MAGVSLTILLYSWLNGVLNNFIGTTANFSTGHVKIMSRAYAEEVDQVPNDLALLGAKDLDAKINHDFPDLFWIHRIKYGGLLDIPDEHGETKSQGPVFGLAVDLLSPSSPEWSILNLKSSLVRGRFPEKNGEIIISDDFAQKLGVNPGETATLISSTMYGSLTTANFTIVGTIRFGMQAMDRGAMIADISDIQYALDMQDAAGEVLGIFKDSLYREEKAEEIAALFNSQYMKMDDEFSPTMVTLRNQQGFGSYLDMISYFSTIFVSIFILAMSIVLWNAGLLGNIRRYGEIGVRLAIGEDKLHLYRSMIAESLLIGFIGSVLGTVLGVAVSYYLQYHGIDISNMMKDMPASIMISNVMRAHVTPGSYVVGFIPGLIATLLGSAFAGIGIFKRQTAILMKELEA